MNPVRFLARVSGKSGEVSFDIFGVKFEMMYPDQFAIHTIYFLSRFSTALRYQTSPTIHWSRFYCLKYSRHRQLVRESFLLERVFLLLVREAFLFKRISLVLVSSNYAC